MKNSTHFQWGCFWVNTFLCLDRDVVAKRDNLQEGVEFIIYTCIKHEIGSIKKNNLTTLRRFNLYGLALLLICNLKNAIPIYFVT